MERSCRRLPSHPLKVCDFPRIPLLRLSENYRIWANRLTIKRVIAA
jgi:hypothetical protein